MSSRRDEFESEPLLDEPQNDDDDEDVEFVLNRDSARSKGAVHYKKDALQQVRLQVEEVTSGMKDNIQKLFERGNNLDELSSRSENLRGASDDFYRTSNRLSRQMWWQQMRTKIVMGSFCLLLILIIIIWAAVKHG